MATIYIHFPWCLAKCPYCDFVSYAAEPEAIDHDGYADAILREAEARAVALAQVSRRPEPPRVTSVFFGGGTPSLWAPAALGRVLSGLRRIFDVTNDAEVTAECNPTSLDEARANALVAAGVNRFSVGTQSTRADQLRFLGRLHDPAGARKAVEAALSSGVGRVSTDLIFGLPGQSPDDARAQAAELAGLGLRHLSCYQLTIEPGTQFGERRKRGLLPMADDGAVADAFLAIDEELERHGLRHYEISNYAEPGQEARHNVSYWLGDEYVGLGCGAFGFVRTDQDGSSSGIRWRNAVVPNDYVERTKRVAQDRIRDDDGLSMQVESLSAEALLRERLMLGLRLADGLDVDAVGRDLGIDPWTTERTRELNRLAERGRIERVGSLVRIPRGAWLFTDDTASRLF